MIPGTRHGTTPRESDSSASKAPPTPMAALPEDSPQAKSASDRWQQWISTGNLAQLEQNEVPADEAPVVAGLCLTHATERGAAVTRILSINDNVRLAAQAILRDGPELSDDADPRVQLAACILGAEHPVDWAGVAPQARERAEDLCQKLCWVRKQAKFGGLQPDPPGARIPPLFQGVGLPFYYSRERYSRENLNGRIGPYGVTAEVFAANLACEQLQKAADGTLMPLKEFVALTPEQMGASLDAVRLTQAAQVERSRNFGIHFTSPNFGQLLLKLSGRLQPGQRMTFPVEWLKKNSAHALRLALEKLPNGQIYVALYDANVTRNIAHLKAFPKWLAELSWDNFDVKGGRRHFGVEVLSLSVPDEALATECFGHFVPPGARIASFAQAIASGDHALAKWTLNELTQPGMLPPISDGAIDDLEGCLSWALQKGHHAEVDLFMWGLPQFGLQPHQIERIAFSENRNGATGLSLALSNKHVWAVQYYLAGLQYLKHNNRLDTNQIVNILVGRGAGRPPPLHLRHADVEGVPMPALEGMGIGPGWHRGIDDVCTSLKDLGLSQGQMFEVVESRDRSGCPAMHTLISQQDDLAIRGLFIGMRKLEFSKEHTTQIAEAWNPSSQQTGLAEAMTRGHWRQVELVLSETRGLEPKQRAKIAYARFANDIPGIFMPILRGDVRGVNQHMNVLTQQEIPIELIVEGLMRPDVEGITPLRKLLDAATPQTLSALSTAIIQFAGRLDPKHKKDFLSALEAADGGSNFIGQPKSDAMKKLKKSSPDAWRQYKEAKDALRR